MNLMVKYPCACHNCKKHTPSEKCSVSSINCETTQAKHNCPVTKCLMFEPKNEFVKEPCQYFANIENGGLKLA